MKSFEPAPRWAVVFAQLIIGGTNHGIHGLLVRIRDDDMSVVPSVRIEDMGHKMGWCVGIDGTQEGLLQNKARVWAWRVGQVKLAGCSGGTGPLGACSC